MGIHEERIAPDAALAGLAMDRNEFVELIARIKKEFGIGIDDRFWRLRTLQDVADYTRRAQFARVMEALL